MCFLWLFAAQRRSCGCILDLLPEALSFFFHLCCRDILFAEFMEITDRLISNLLCFPEDCVRFLVCLSDDTVSLFIQFCLSLGCLLLQAFSLAAVRCDLFPLFFDRAAACLKIAQQILKGDILFAQPFFRILDNVVRQPQFAGYGKRIALPGDSDEQAVSRTQALYIEFTACIFHARSGERIYLEFAVMCSSHSADIMLVQVGQDSNSKRSSLGGICSCPQLVKEDEGMLIHFLQEGNNISHV